MRSLRSAASQSLDRPQQLEHLLRLNTGIKPSVVELASSDAGGSMAPLNISGLRKRTYLDVGNDALFGAAHSQAWLDSASKTVARKQQKQNNLLRAKP